MDLRKNNVALKRRRVSRRTAASAPPVLTPRRIALPLEMVLYMADFMCFEDYRRFVMALYPHNVMSDLIRKKLWELSTFKTETMFANGRPVAIEYNFDPFRIREERILMNVACLSPIFGGIVSLNMQKFTGLSELKNFVKMHIHLDQCSDARFATCPCHLADRASRSFDDFQAPLANGCPYRHYHHYCSHHVASWLDLLESTLTVQRYDFSGDRTRSCILFEDNNIYVHGVPMQRHGSILYRMLQS